MPSFTGHDGSETIKTGGTAQYLFDAKSATDAPANGFEIHNPDPDEDLWIREGAVAAVNGLGSRLIPANGGWYQTPAGRAPLGAVSVIGATTGHKILAIRW